MTHTPGPWHVNNMMVVCDASDNDVTWPSIAAQLVEAKDNAHLIAAAPDLLAALKQLVADYGDVPDPTDEDGQTVFNDARAAIDKAEGKS